MSHEALANGLFNEGHCAATATMEAWEQGLVNTPPVLELLLTSLEPDCTGMRSKMRKAFNGAAVVLCLNKINIDLQRVMDFVVVHELLQSQETAQRRCALFLAALDALDEQLPSDFAARERPNLMKALLSARKV